MDAEIMGEVTRKLLADAAGDESVLTEAQRVERAEQRVTLLASCSSLARAHGEAIRYFDRSTVTLRPTDNPDIHDVYTLRGKTACRIRCIRGRYRFESVN